MTISPLLRHRSQRLSRPRAFRLSFLATASLPALLAAHPVQAQTYAFTDLIDTTSAAGLSGFSTPIVSTNGTVAFTAAHSGSTNLYSYDGTNLKTIASGQTYSGLGSYSINSSGTVAFGANYSIYTGSGGIVSTVVTGNSSQSYLAPSISSTGAVAYLGANQFNYTGVYEKSGGTTTQLAAVGANPNYDSIESTPFIQPNGTTVAFVADKMTGGNYTTGVFNVTGSGSASTIQSANENDHTFEVLGSVGPSVSINSAGRTAFYESYSGFSGGAIYARTGSGGLTTQIAAQGGSGITNFVSGPSINASGLVSFLADSSVDGGTLALFVGDGVAVNPYPIVRTGDALFGSVVSDLKTLNQNLTDDNRITFFFTLQDGRSGVATATYTTNGTEPTYVGLPGSTSGAAPEPAALALLLPTLPVLARRIRRGMIAG